MPKLGLGQSIGKKALTTPTVISTGRNVWAPFDSPGQTGTPNAGMALEFDGVSDEISFDPIMGGETELTIACWIKKDVGAHATVDGSIVGYNAGGTYWRFTNDTTLHFYLKTAQNDISYNITWSDDGNWHYVVVTWEQNTVSKMYVDGSLTGTSSSSYRGPINATSGRIARIGNYASVGANLFSGKMSNIQIWNKEWSADEVSYAYNNPESLVLGASGTSLTYSDLKLWYPMQDNHRGNQSYLLDGANTGRSVVATSDGGTYTGGNASIFPTDSNGNNVYKVQGQMYEYTWTITESTSGTGVKVFPESSTYVSAVGTYTETWMASSSSDRLRLYIHGFTGKISNVSVSAVNLKNHGTSVFYGDELITNGDMSSATGWTLTNWSIGSNVLTGSSTTGVARQTGILTVGRTYQVIWSIKSATGGSVKVQCGTANGATKTSAEDDITEIITCTGDTNFVIDGVDAFSGTIDDVSVKEVGFASGWTDGDLNPLIPQLPFQSYNELTWFDGDADYINMGGASHTALDNIFDSGASFSAWIFPNTDGEGGVGNIFSKGGNTVFRLSSISGNFCKLHLIKAFSGGPDVDGSFYTADTVVPLGKWSHVVVVYTAAAGTSPVMYVNGVEAELASVETSTGTNPTTDAASNFLIGNSGGYDAGFEGCINEISVWDRELSSSQVKRLYNDGIALNALDHSAAGNLASYWRDNAGSSWKDLGPNKVNGSPTSIDEVLIIPEGIDGKDSQGFEMNRFRTSGLNYPRDYHWHGSIDKGSTTTISDGDAFTITVWLKPSFIGVNYFIGSGGDRIQIDTANTLKWRVTTGGAVEYTLYYKMAGQSASSFVADTWYHIGITKAADDSVKLYVDGVLQTDVDNSGNNFVDLNDKVFQYRYLGSQSTENNFRGSVDDLAIYDSTELSAAQIKRNYNAGKRRHQN